MRILAFTAAALVAGNTAEAAIYNFSFITAAPHGQQTVSLDLLSLANVNVEQMVDMESSDDCECGYFESPIVSPLKVPSYASAYFRLLTDSLGNIVDIEYQWSEDMFAWSWGKHSFTESTWDEDYTSETFAGHWRISTVPLPASAIVLMGALAGLAGLRRFRD